MKNMDKKITEKLDQVFSGFPNTDAPKSAMKEFRRRYTKRRDFVTIFSRVAAVLIIPLLSLVLYQFFSQTREQTPTLAGSVNYSAPIMEYTVNSGVRGRVVLPDGSEVWLNSNSSLKVPAVFGEHARVVELNGEAFFDVLGDKQRPLYVRTNRNITARVTGTRFNISTYCNDELISLHLISGEVELINENNRRRFSVLPNQKVYVMDGQQDFNLVKSPDERLNTGWKKGYLVFDGMRMSEVIRRMERWYGVEIVVTSPQILDERFTGEFRSESLTQVLDFLRISSGIDSEITNGTVILSY